MSARMSKQGRVEARRRFLQEQKERKDLEAHITKLEELGELEKQPGDGGVSLEALGLVEIPFSPATKFFMERLHKVSPDDTQFDSKWKLAVIDLVDSGVPLDRHTRSKIAGELRRLYFPNSERDKRAKLRNELAMIEDQKHYLLNRGMTAAEAEREIAASLGFKTVGALQKHIQRARFSTTKN
jgi:hypothetical protein